MWTRQQTHSQDFTTWLEQEVIDDESVPEHIKELVRGPNNIVQSFSGILLMVTSFILEDVILNVNHIIMDIIVLYIHAHTCTIAFGFI